MSKDKQRFQPLITDGEGRQAFKQNEIVRTLLNESSQRGFGLNELAEAKYEFSQSDWKQFYQLIGYTLTGYHEMFGE